MVKVGRNKEYAKATSNSHYDDAFEDIMSYAETHVSPSRELKSKNDLLAIFKKINAIEHKKGKKGNINLDSDKFIKAMNDRAIAKGYYGRVVGGKQNKGVTEDVAHARQEKIKQYRRDGREVYGYDDGFAVKTVYVNKNNKAVVSFRNVDNGRFVKKDKVSYID